MDRGVWRAPCHQGKESHRVRHDWRTNSNVIVLKAVALFCHNSTSSVTVLLYCQSPPSAVAALLNCIAPLLLSLPPYSNRSSSTILAPLCCHSDSFPCRVAVLYWRPSRVIAPLYCQSPPPHTLTVLSPLSYFTSCCHGPPSAVKGPPLLK